MNLFLKVQGYGTTATGFYKGILNRAVLSTIPGEAKSPDKVDRPTGWRKLMKVDIDTYQVNCYIHLVWPDIP